jgi:hypothetical protein
MNDLHAVPTLLPKAAPTTEFDEAPHASDGEPPTTPTHIRFLMSNGDDDDPYPVMNSLNPAMADSIPIRGTHTLKTIDPHPRRTSSHLNCCAHVKHTPLPS